MQIKPYPLDENYLIYSDGRVFSKKSNRFLTPTLNKTNGYLYVSLGRKLPKKNIHRLVAECFIPNPNNLPQVNHKDENKQNNNVENLEWCTQNYNLCYGTAAERARLKKLNNSPTAKKVLQFDKNNNLIAEYSSMQDAARKTGIDRGSISKAARGIAKSAGGFTWKLKQIENNK